MEIILNVQPGSVYAKFNGYKFNAAEVYKTGLSIKGLNPEFPNSKVDFATTEVILVDVAKTLKWYRLSENKAFKTFVESYFLAKCTTINKVFENFTEIANNNPQLFNT